MTREKSAAGSSATPHTWPNDLPPFVTFATGAALLRRFDIDPFADAQSVRYLARAHTEKGIWPFGNGPGLMPYGQVANARTMETGIFLTHCAEHPPNPRGRGRDKQPRRSPRQ
ncbi:hypothetical protein ABT357_25415 [Streptomyces albidoflavus]|uniref:hypothetical protein n=1 Tax=Streptomyces albidoflavus TaxID=1886 RepID=UPI00332F44FB